MAGCIRRDSRRDLKLRGPFSDPQHLLMTPGGTEPPAGTVLMLAWPSLA